MDVTLILADAAKVHPDSTFSLLRGGITTVNVPRSAPILFKGALLVRVTGVPSETGTHEIGIVCVDADGGRIGQDVSGSFEIPSTGGSVQLVIDMGMILPRHGTYEFAVTVDKQQMARWPLETKEVAPRGGGGGS